MNKGKNRRGLGKLGTMTGAIVATASLAAAPIAGAFVPEPIKPPWAGEDRLIYFEVYEPTSNNPVPGTEWYLKNEKSEARQFYSDWEDEHMPDYRGHRNGFNVRDNNWTSPDDEGKPWIQQNLIRDLDPREGHIAISTDNAGFYPENDGQEMQWQIELSQKWSYGGGRHCNAEGEDADNEFIFDSSSFTPRGAGENPPEVEGFTPDRIWSFGRFYNCFLHQRPPTIDVPWTKAAPVTVTSTVTPALETKVVEQDNVTLAPSTVTATAAPEEVDGPSVTVTSTAPANTTTLAPVTVTASPVKKEVAGPVTTIQGRTVTVPGSTVSVPGGTNVSTVTLPAAVTTLTETVTQEPAAVAVGDVPSSEEPRENGIATSKKPEVIATSSAVVTPIEEPADRSGDVQDVETGNRQVNRPEDDQVALPGGEPADVAEAVTTSTEENAPNEVEVASGESHENRGVRAVLATTGANSYALAGLGAVLAALVALAVVSRRKTASQ